MRKPQGRIDRSGKLYFDRLELLNYALDLEEIRRGDSKENMFEVRLAVDESYIFKVGGRVVGREHPGVPEMLGAGGAVCRSADHSTGSVKYKVVGRRFVAVKSKTVGQPNTFKRCRKTK